MELKEALQYDISWIAEYLKEHSGYDGEKLFEAWEVLQQAGITVENLKTLELTRNMDYYQQMCLRLWHLLFEALSQIDPERHPELCHQIKALYEECLGDVLLPSWRQTRPASEGEDSPSVPYGESPVRQWAYTFDRMTRVVNQSLTDLQGLVNVLAGDQPATAIATHIADELGRALKEAKEEP